jgi:hemerythrin
MVTEELQWDASLSIGIDPLDYEHRNLFDTINRLNEEMERQTDPQAIEECLGEIHARMLAHFALEESFMREKKFQGLAAHKAQHDALIDEITAVIVDFENDPRGVRLGDLRTMLADWIIGHVRSSDKQMSSMLD